MAAIDERPEALPAGRKDLRPKEELRRAQAQLEDERRRYRELFELAPVGHCVTDPYGLVLEVNPAVAALVGSPPELLLGRPLVEHVDTRDRRRFRRRLHGLAAGETRSWELRLRRPDGEPVWVELAVARSHASDSLRWAIRDISGHKRTEEELERATAELERRVRRRAGEVERGRALLEAVLRELPDGVVIVDARSRDVLLANRQARELLGDVFGSGEQLLAALVERMRPIDGSGYARDDLPLARALAEGVVVERELAEYVLGEQAATLEVGAVPVRSERGALVAAVAVFADVTERQRVERAMKEFVTNAAHELQTPIAAIMGASDVLRAGAKSRARDRDRFLGHIDEQARRLARLVRTLLVLARVQSGLEPPPRETVRLGPLLETIAAGVRVPETVAVEVECPPGLAVVANEDLVEQALHNLAANAARHTTEGRLVLAAREHDSLRVAIEVGDTGGGIPEEALGRVFDRFYRASGRQDGFGLGLAIVREVVDALDGEVEVESALGVGTTVRLLLPGVRLPGT